MNNNFNQESLYPFEWLDETIEITLNPQRNRTAFDPQTLKALEKRFEAEIQKVLRALKNQTFAHYSESEQRVIVGQYCLATEILSLQANLNQKQYNTPALKKTGLQLIRLLTELSEQIAKRYAAYLPNKPAPIPALSEPIRRFSFKLLCQLSADQIAIVLKACDDTKLILARSIRMVFQAIVPFLSTPNKNDLSWDSVRSASYHPEEHDKAQAIAALENLIQKIREYR